MNTPLTCRFCHSSLENSFCDLGMSPLSNAYLTEKDLKKDEPFFPLHAYVCHECLLVQLPEHKSSHEIFSDYAYFSSYSESWLRHAKDYVERITERLKLDRSSFVVEIASNDGYLLQYFLEKNIPCLGIEPAANVAEVAQRKGVSTLVKFFGARTASELAEKKKADLILGNNVLAHVPDLNDFVRGLKTLLAPHGTITLEFPHLLQLMEHNQFDTIYHEHFSYFSLLTVEKIFAFHGLTIFDVQELPTHGGSLRIFVRHSTDKIEQAVLNVRKKEQDYGLDRLKTYLSWAEKIKAVKYSLLDFLIQAHREGKNVVGYGAPAKGNTLLNYCGIRPDLIKYTVDRSPHKQGRFLPGTHIPIKSPQEILRTKPDYVLILPWNLKEEIIAQLATVREWGGKFVIPIPKVEVV